MCAGGGHSHHQLQVDPLTDTKASTHTRTHTRTHARTHAHACTFTPEFSTVGVHPNHVLLWIVGKAHVDGGVGGHGRLLAATNELVERRNEDVRWLCVQNLCEQALESQAAEVARRCERKCTLRRHVPAESLFILGRCDRSVLMAHVPEHPRLLGFASRQIKPTPKSPYDQMMTSLGTRVCPMVCAKQGATKRQEQQ